MLGRVPGWYLSWYGRRINQTGVTWDYITLVPVPNPSRDLR